jgi:hypothetical protein
VRDDQSERNTRIDIQRLHHEKYVRSLVELLSSAPFRFIGEGRSHFGLTFLVSGSAQCPTHVPFLTSAFAYEKYVEYWNDKVSTLLGDLRGQSKSSKT